MTFHLVYQVSCTFHFEPSRCQGDRWLAIASNARTRQRSTCRLAFICVTGGTLFWALFHIHAIIFATITHLDPTISYCYFQPGVELTFVAYYSIIKELLTVSLMIICGLWAIRNIRGTRRVTAAPSLSVNRTATEGGANSSSKDRQMFIMLVMDIIIYAPFSFGLAIFLMYQQIIQNSLTTIEQVLIQSILTNIFLFGAGIPFCTSCYANLIVSKAFRKEVKRVLSCQ
jgi:hypothetical protein